MSKPTAIQADELEVRSGGCELRAVDSEDAAQKIVGYASVFNSLSADLGGFHEIILPGAFAEALRDADVRALINHDPTLVIGRTRAGSLVLGEDAKGLFASITLPDTQAARDLHALVKRGDVSGMSIGFTVSKADQVWSRDGAGPWIRTIRRVNRLVEVSVVTFPAYDQTSASARSLYQQYAVESERRQKDAELRYRRLRLLEVALAP